MGCPLFFRNGIISNFLRAIIREEHGALRVKNRMPFSDMCGQEIKGGCAELIEGDLTSSVLESAVAWRKDCVGSARELRVESCVARGG